MCLPSTSATLMGDSSFIAQMLALRRSSTLQGGHNVMGSNIGDFPNNTSNQESQGFKSEELDGQTFEDTKVVLIHEQVQSSSCERTSFQSRVREIPPKSTNNPPFLPLATALKTMADTCVS